MHAVYVRSTGKIAWYCTNSSTVMTTMTMMMMVVVVMVMVIAEVYSFGKQNNAVLFVII